MLERPLAFGSALADMSRLSPLVVDRIGVVSNAAARGAGPSVPDEMLYTGSGVDRGRVLAGSSPSARARPATGCLAAEAADGFCGWLGRSERGGSELECERP